MAAKKKTKNLRTNSLVSMRDQGIQYARDHYAPYDLLRSFDDIESAYGDGIKEGLRILLEEAEQ